MHSFHSYFLTSCKSTAISVFSILSLQLLWKTSYFIFNRNGDKTVTYAQEGYACLYKQGTGSLQSIRNMNKIWRSFIILVHLLPCLAGMNISKEK